MEMIAIYSNRPDHRKGEDKPEGTCFWEMKQTMELVKTLPYLFSLPERDIITL